MTKKDRLGSDPFKESSLNWIQDTREEKKDSKELNKQKPKTSKHQNAKTLKRYDVKTSKSLSVKASKQDKIKKPDPKKRHTIYLSPKQSKKLKVYAAGNDMKLSEVIEKLIDKNI